jgi:hypothetical protein
MLCVESHGFLALARRPRIRNSRIHDYSLFTSTLTAPAVFRLTGREAARHGDAILSRNIGVHALLMAIAASIDRSCYG